MDNNLYDIKPIEREGTGGTGGKSRSRGSIAPVAMVAGHEGVTGAYQWPSRFFVAAPLTVLSAQRLLAKHDIVRYRSGPDRADWILAGPVGWNQLHASNPGEERLLFSAINIT